MVQRTLCALKVIFLCAIGLVYSGTEDYVVIKKDFAKILRSPYGDSKQVGLAIKGDRFKILSQQGEWYSINYHGSEFWVYSANISVDRTTPPPAPAADKPPAVSVSSQGVLPASIDTDVSRKTKPVPIVRPQKNGSTFPISEGRTKKYPTKKPPSMENTPTKQIDAVEKLVSEIANSVDSSRNIRRPPSDSLPSVNAVFPAPAPTPPPAPAATPPFPVRKYFEITASPAKILKNLSPQSPILIFAKKNDVFPLVYSGSSWCKIAVKNDTGWVETSRGRIVDSPPGLTAKMPAIVVISLLSAGFALVLIFVIVFVRISLRRQNFTRSSLKRDVLIISDSEKEINYSLTDTGTTLAKCFSEIGFKVRLATDVENARTILAHYAPDVIVVDWQLEKNIQPTIWSIMSDKETIASILIIFYNVPDPTESARRRTAPNLYFLGLVFSDRDIFKIVTPLIMSGSSHKAVKKSVQTSALEGTIRSGSLIEVMQFIEIGKKTGCLYITQNSPFGLIYFEQGRITYAASKTARGRDAVFEILDLKEGHFHLVLDKVSQTKNVNLSTLEVLMDWTKVKDEALRD